MAEFECPVQAGFFHQRSASQSEVTFLPYWATSHVQYAQNLLECSDEPIEYDHDDEDYKDNCFFFPEDCVCPPRKDSGYYEYLDSQVQYTDDVGGAKNDAMTPELPDIRMLDTEALSDLLEDNLSPPEITSILVFATNGAIFAYASPLSTRQLRNLSATYGAAYTSYAKTVSSGNLTGVNPASHPSSFVTAQSYSLGDVGSIVFELENQVAVVTKIADKVLLAVVGPSRLQEEAGEETREAEAGNGAGVEGAGALKSAEPAPAGPNVVANGTASATSTRPIHRDPSPRPQQQPPTPGAVACTGNRADPNADPDAILQRQYEIDRSNDLARLASLNLSSSPAILLALESKSAALGRFLSQKLEDLESPEDF
ncbi:hypothetical protein VTN00DRAFT_4982 [Thermoascus crustaceus]|uniref:uncharacterized protein n=1 Tax=Thermoascus crustaceus TaxID=5088 RepID=UPI003742AD86